MKPLFLAMTLLIMVALVNGCARRGLDTTTAPTASMPASHPEGMKSPMRLTDAQKDRVVETALNTPEAKARLSGEATYRTSLSWIAIVWNNSDVSEWRGIDYEWEGDLNLALVSPEAVYYSRVVINFGEPPKWQVMVAVNPLTGKVALVEENPYRTGPPT